MGNSLALTLPEIILTLAALALLMVAAYAGDKSARLATWLALAAFVAAALVVPGVFDRGGVGFDGLFIADSFAAFAKRSEEHTSELQSLMRISYAVFFLKKKK